MNLEDIKDQLRERGHEVWNKVQESNLYITLRERYDNLPPRWQKVVVGVGGFLLVYLIYSIPAGYVSASVESEGYFADNRQLTRDLIRAGRLQQTLKPPPPAPNFASLQSQIQAAMARQKILDNQRRPVTELDNVAEKKLVPKGIDQLGLKLGAQKLNLKQVIEMAEDLDQLDSTKVINMSFQADPQDPHYYSVDYELAAFSIPFEPEGDDNAKNKKGSRGSKKKR